MNKRKIGFFFLAFIPVLLAQAVQFFAIIFVYGVSAVTGVLSNLGAGSVRSSLNQIFYMFSDYNFSSFIMIIYSIIIICCFGLWYYTRLGGEFKPDFKNNFNMYKLLGIILLVPGAQFLSSVIANITALIMPSWMQSYEELFESAGFESDITIVLFPVLGYFCSCMRGTYIPRCDNESCQSSCTFLGSQPLTGFPLWCLSPELDSGNICLCSGTYAGLCV